MAIKFLNTATAATQAVGDNSTKIATTAYADAAAAAIPIGDYVTLATAQTISGAKTFNNDVTLNNTYLLGVDKLEANQIVIGTSTSSILGNVGIGTTSPTTSYSKVLQIHASGNGSTLRLTDSVSGSLIGSGLELLQYGIDSYIINRESGPMYFMTSSTTKMTILANGSVGINTTSPNQKLHVNGATQLGDINATASFGTVALKVVEGSISTGPTLGSGTVGAQAVLYSNGLFGMYTGVSPATGDTWMQSQRNDASTSAYNILLNPAGGNVGIGGGTPFGKLDVAGNIRLQSANQIYFGGTGSIPYWNVGVENTTNNNFEIAGVTYYSGDRDILLTPVNNGNVGIKSTSPSYELDVTGTIRATGDVIAYSDARVKDNVITIDNALDKVTKLRGVSYTRNDVEDKTTKVGVIAQEVLEVLPEVVQQDDEGKYSVAYGNMVGLLIESIKELKAEVDELKSRL